MVRIERISDRALKVFSPAKVNLILKILGRRPDGYHEIITLMQCISLYDILEISKEKLGISTSCNDPMVPEGRENLAYRAAELFLQQTGMDFGVRICIEKNIPVAAGLGGGSGNAASVLLALNEISGLHLKREKLMEMGAYLGADVPFFLYQSPAWATGIGEKLSSIKFNFGLWYLLINPGFPLSTHWAYQLFSAHKRLCYNFRLTKREININISILIRDFERLNTMLENDLEEVVFRAYPEMGKLKEKLLSLGCPGTLMSGSGPTIFGIFRSKEEAKKIYNKICFEFSGGNYRFFLAEGI